MDPSLLQMNNASFVSHGLCPFDPRPEATLPGDKDQKSYTTSSGLNCLDNGSPHDSECWNILELDDWLAQWFKSTPQCAPSAPSQFDCNKRDPPEPWTTTFMRIAMGGGGWNGCSEVRNANCQYNPDPCLGEGDTDLTKARYKYVAYTISQIHQFFSTWSALMDSTMNQAADSVSGMISLVDPIKKQKTGLRLFLNILTFGLSIVSSLDLGLTSIQTTIFTTVIDAIGKAPVVHDQLWPKESAESQDIQVDQLTDQLQGPTGIHTTILDNLDRTLEVVQGTNQTDVSAFLAFASGGHFSIDSTQSPFADLGSAVHKGLLQIITTYLISEALDKNDWHALIVPGANPLTLDQGTGLCPKWAEGTEKYQCDWWDGSTKWFACESLDEHSQCENYWWYSKTHNSAYALVKNGKRGPDKQGGEFLRTIFEKGWSTGPLLFENAAICEFSSLMSQSAGSISYTSDYNGTAGFFYQGPPFTGYYDVNETTKFVSIPGGDTGNAFVAATWHQDSLSMMVHPNTIFDSGGPEWGSRCVSQLNTTVANSWNPKGGHWTENNAES
ncbi:MAG: hypothetical protein LQ346_003134 [Caloplaca aetnensis]|nr:MAG: hypothetical protein LQ346_003134 [Caloplaca aetnensis]